MAPDVRNRAGSDFTLYVKSLPARFSSTYRLQLSQEWGLDRAADTLDYLSALGVDVCYTSPYFTAGLGSSGYDVCDHSKIQPELGGEAAFSRFTDALTQNGLGHLIDIVPNHMGVDASRNRWWREVLEQGRDAAAAAFFDIDWSPVKPELTNRILLPMLDRPYGIALDDGVVKLAVDDGRYVVRAGDQALPTRPGSIPDGTRPDTLGPDALHELLERQVYRLAYWRTASEEINYRRFFDVDGLVGLRMERPEVFEAAHAYVRRLIEDGTVTGIRVDHPDGLARPAEYFERLRSLAGPPNREPLVIVAEKILTGAERLPEEWPVDGTTGYEFLNLVNGLFIDPAGAARLRRLYTRLTQRRISFGEECYSSKKLIMSTTMASEVHMLAHRLNRISERHPRSRDFTLNTLRRALVEIISNLDVYRTYLAPDRRVPEDIRRIRTAVSRAIERNPALEPSVYRFIESVVLGADAPDGGVTYPPRDGADRTDRERLVERLQQFTGSVFAKGVEDTAFYRYQPLLSANEVGGDASVLGRKPAEFHAANVWRAASAPRGLLATSTHDTKFGEDARARINVLSELAEEWHAALSRWRRLERATKTGRETARVVDPNDAYRFYQALVGVWPVDRDPADAAPSLAERLAGFMRKSVREAKVHTSWLNQNDVYEAAVDRLVRDAVTRLAAATADDPGMLFMRRVARAGAVNSLATLALKMGAPGIVDTYQGAELWDLNLVDPDNRRPVDFGARRRELDALESLLTAVERGGDAGADVRALLDDWPSGRIKLLMTAACLRLRRRRPALFVGAAYEPLVATGPAADAIVSYLRGDRNDGLVVIAPRFCASRMSDNGWPLGDAAWADTHVILPPPLADARLVNVVTGERVGVQYIDGRPAVPVARVFASCPAALFLAARSS